MVPCTDDTGLTLLQFTCCLITTTANEVVRAFPRPDARDSLPQRDYA